MIAYGIYGMILRTVKQMSHTPTKQQARVAGPQRSLPSGVRKTTRNGKVRKEFWLDPKLVRKAQEYLGTASERETIEMALDLVTFRKELRAGARALTALKLSRID